MPFTRLGRAVVKGKLDLVRKYLEEGDNVNELIDRRRGGDDDADYGRLPGSNATPLIAACFQQWIEESDGKMENIPAIIDLLLDKGADVNHKTSNKATPLLLACRWEGTFVIDRAIKRMVNLGADVNATVLKAEETLTPLSSLCWQLDKRNSTPESDRKRLECLRLLLDKGADPNGRVKEGMSTPLHLALYRARQGSDAAIQAAVILIRRNADLTIRDEYDYKGKDPEEYAGPELWDKIMERLEDISAAKEFGKVRDVPRDVVRNIQEFVIGKKGGVRKTRRRKTLRRK